MESDFEWVGIAFEVCFVFVVFFFRKRLKMGQLIEVACAPNVKLSTTESAGNQSRKIQLFVIRKKKELTSLFVSHNMICRHSNFFHSVCMHGCFVIG